MPRRTSKSPPYKTPKRTDVSPRTLFAEQLTAARKRGIAFELTFEQWMSVWSRSEKFSERGCRVGQYVMARPGDIGAYSIDNVMIITCSENHSQARAAAQAQRWGT